MHVKMKINYNKKLYHRVELTISIDVESYKKTIAIKKCYIILENHQFFLNHTLEILNVTLFYLYALSLIYMLHINLFFKFVCFNSSFMMFLETKLLYLE